MSDTGTEFPVQMNQSQFGIENTPGILLPKIISYNPDIDSPEALEAHIGEANKKNKQFFGKDIEGIKVYLLYSREEMDKACGYKTPESFAGYAADKEKTAVIFSPSVIPKVTPFQAADFQSLLAHEFAHIYSKDLFNLKYPRWLAEGLACHVAEQYETRTPKISGIQKFSEIHDDEGWNNTNPYDQGYSFTAYLLKRFGKEKMLSLLQSLSPDITYDNFTGKFNEAYSSDFEECQNEWAKTIVQPPSVNTGEEITG